MASNLVDMASNLVTLILPIFSGAFSTLQVASPPGSPVAKMTKDVTRCQVISGMAGGLLILAKCATECFTRDNIY